MEFKNRIVMIGYGVVAQALLPMLVKHLRVPCAKIVVIDFVDRTAVLKPWIEKGLRFFHERVTPFSLARLLSTHARAGDLIVDLAWSVDFFDIVQWAHDSEVLYINASLESWDPTAEMHRKPTLEKSLYTRYTKLLPLIEKWRRGTTAVVDHGANPGLVSHFVKLGLLDIGDAVLRENKLSAARKRRIERLLADEAFPELARELGVKVIHCSEWDSQRADKAKSPDEFVSTWSPEGMWEESISPCEIGWGTHEKWIPPLATQPVTGPRNQIVLPQMGLNTWVRSWVPNQEIVGMVVTHGESFGLSHALTVRENDQVVYRPTVHYAYLPSNDSIVSMHELRARNYDPHRSLANGSIAFAGLIARSSWERGNERVCLAVLHRGRATIEYLIRTADGALVEVEDCFTPVVSSAGKLLPIEGSIVRARSDRAIAWSAPRSGEFQLPGPIHSPSLY